MKRMKLWKILTPEASSDQNEHFDTQNEKITSEKLDEGESATNPKLNGSIISKEDCVINHESLNQVTSPNGPFLQPSRSCIRKQRGPWFLQMFDICMNCKDDDERQRHRIRSMSRVSFTESLDVHEIPGIDDIDERERETLWWSETDYEKFANFSMVIHRSHGTLQKLTPTDYMGYLDTSYVTHTDLTVPLPKNKKSEKGEGVWLKQ
mmetsp:Transcript_24357/g.31466  ORF Transcript_24357/g.31466 Transcript_24357/m.31466 type:complete len:207 (-) Transcript_24357:158-778(-)